MPLVLQRRRRHAASAVGPEFDFARAGALAGPEAAVALSGRRVLVVTDGHGGRRLHEEEGGALRLVEGGPEWIDRLDGDGVVSAWPADPVTGETGSPATFDGDRWLAAEAGRAPVAGPVRHPDRPLTFHSRPRSPGETLCAVRDDERQAVVARWTAPLCGRPAWDGDRLWVRYEAWPRQRLVALAADGSGPVDEHALPVGRLSGLVVGPATAAAVWSDPATPASLVVAPDVAGLVCHVQDRAAAPASGPATRVGEVAGVPVVVHTPPGSPAGTLVLLHGGPHALCWPTFSPLVAFLCRHGWRVVTPNVSSSAMADRPPAPCTLGVTDAHDVVRLAAAYRGDGPVVLGGWSYGAYVAARAVALGATCDGLVSLSGFLTAGAIATSTVPAVVAFRDGASLPATAPSDLGDVPVFAVHGRHDRRVPVAGHRAYVDRLPNGSFLELPHEGHGIITDAGAAVAYPALVSWLSRRSG